MILGGDGDDRIAGGGGNDVLVGGAGVDTYTVEGNDTIIDSDGKGIVRDKNGQQITGIFIKQADGSYVWANNSQVTATKNSPLTLYLADGSTVVIEDQINNGDFGLDLIDSPTDPVTNYTITGDLNPQIDANGNPKVDAWGNIISDGTTSPNKNDTIYDTTGNDIIEGGQGQDSIWGGDGNDQIFGENYGQMSDLVTKGETAQSLNQTGDYLVGEAGDDFIYGGDAKDTIYGGQGNDMLIGGGGDDEIYGGTVYFILS